jgi:flavin reductase (DIM6/NTAB) family NADH-FMN oxidoreductase RutF
MSSLSIPSSTAQVAECKAHLECRLVEQRTYGAEVILIGQIVALYLDEGALHVQDPSAYLRVLVFLEAGTYGVVEHAHRVARPDS